jgi:hypothetical protein
MGNIQIKNVPDEVHSELRRRAEEAGLSLRDYVLRLIRRDQLLPSRKEWLRSLKELEKVEGGPSAAELIAEGRAERVAQLDAAIGLRKDDADGDSR